MLSAPFHRTELAPRAVPGLPLVRVIVRRVVAPDLISMVTPAVAGSVRRQEMLTAPRGGLDRLVMPPLRRRLVAETLARAALHCSKRARARKLLYMTCQVRRQQRLNS